MSYEMTLWGNTISDSRVRLTLSLCKKHNILPSFPLTLYHFEGMWGGTAVAKNNNNWGGMTWAWSGNTAERNGIKLKKGTNRPPNEGGGYIEYQSVEDFIHDWFFIMKVGSLYNVTNKANFQETVKGQFIYGGAQRDYATMYLHNSKDRYEAYYKRMKARRDAINQANNNLLDKLDAEFKELDIPFPDTTFPIVPQLESIIANLKNNFNHYQKELIGKVFDSLSNDLYQLSEIKYGNGYIHIDKLMDNMYKVKLNNGLVDILNETQENSNKDNEITTDTEKDITTGPGGIVPDLGTGNNPIWPTTSKRVTSPYGPRNKPTAGASSWHSGIDIGRDIVNQPVYACQSGKIAFTLTNKNTVWGYAIAIIHDKDPYSSLYQHLRDKPTQKVGQYVKKGEIINYVGATGIGTGPHLHWAISKLPQNQIVDANSFFGPYKTIDPQEYIRMKF